MAARSPPRSRTDFAVLVTSMVVVSAIPLALPIFQRRLVKQDTSGKLAMSFDPPGMAGFFWVAGHR